ncbi:MAG: molybdenum cofactor guanylyltransferase MobA [Mangrovicoccus sp.]
MKPAGIILAGGQARRMGGGDKGEAVLAGRSLFDRVIDRLAPQLPAIAINANGPKERLAEYSLPVIADPVPDHPGPLAGVLAGMIWAESLGYDHIVTVAADTPFFPEDLVERLIRAAEKAKTPIAMAAIMEEGRLIRQPTFALWPVRLQSALREALAKDQRRVVHFADHFGSASTLFATEAFFNINTPEDLAEAEALLKDGTT